uniref:Beta-defensin-like domain-containing protein n=1 Tax=Gopherus agassizii TaxID=38772 RepID=A0A452HDN3_9SAUR
HQPSVMRILHLFLALLFLVFHTATEHILSDTVICRKTQGKCSFAICPFFMKANGTCYNGKAKCCRPWL